VTGTDVSSVEDASTVAPAESNVETFASPVGDVAGPESSGPMERSASEDGWTRPPQAAMQTASAASRGAVVRGVRMSDGYRVSRADARKGGARREVGHVGAVFSPKSRAIRVYIDGALITTCPLSEAGLRRTTDKLYIGAGMVGMLDEVRVYAAELGDADIAGLAKAE
jgi:hypothetical protein